MIGDKSGEDSFYKLDWNNKRKQSLPTRRGRWVLFYPKWERLGNEGWRRSGVRYGSTI
jgi:hypothetical protein